MLLKKDYDKRLNEVLKKDYDVYEIYLTENFHLFFERYNNGDLCIELADNYGESININTLVNYTLDTEICDIYEDFINLCIGKMLYGGKND